MRFESTQPIKSIIIVCAVVFLTGFCFYAFTDESPDMKQNTGNRITHTAVPYQPLTYELLERFHGHLGPYAVFGALIGEHAINHFNVPRYFGLEVQAECQDQPPFSCLIDGLQVSLGTTMGKKNIRHIPAESIRVTILVHETKKKYIYSIKSSAIGMLKKWTQEGLDVEESGRRLFKMKPEEVLSFEEK